MGALPRLQIMSTDRDVERSLARQKKKRAEAEREDSCKVVFKYSSPSVIHTLTTSDVHTHSHSHSQVFALLHFPKLPKLAKASCLGGPTAGVMECVRPIPTPGTPMPVIPPIITGAAMPIFMLMFIPIMPWFTGIPPIPMVPVVIEVGIPVVKEAGMPVATDVGMPIIMALPAIMGLAGGLMGVTWGGELRFSPPKFWANKLTGGTPCCWMILLSVGGDLVGLRPADRKSRLMLTEGSDQVDPNDP